MHVLAALQLQLKTTSQVLPAEQLLAAGKLKRDFSHRCFLRSFQQ